MSFNLNRADNDLQITANQVKFTSNDYTSNIIIDLSNTNTSMINMNPNSSNFVGFMANSSGLYVKSNPSATGFEPISGSGVNFTPNIALELVSGNNLNVRYNPDILSIDGSNRLNISNGAIQNNKLANTSIQIGNVNVALGNAITSIYAGNIFGQLSATNLPLSFDNVAVSNINFTSGKLNNISIGTSTPNNAIFNNVLVNYNANITGNLNIGSASKYTMITNNTTANTITLLSTAETSNLALVSDTNSHLFFGTTNNIGLRLLNTGNLEVSSNVLGNWSKLYTLGDLVAGNGLIKSGTDNNTIDVRVDDTTLTIISDILSVKDSGISATQLADNAVTTIKIADSNITTNKLADNAVTTIKIADSNVTTIKIADSNITTNKLANLSVTNSKIANSTVTIGGQTLALGDSLNTVTDWTVTNQLTTNNGNVQGTLYFGNLDHHITFNSGTDKIDIHGNVSIMNTLTVSNTVTISGNLFVTGNTYFVNSNVTTITDPVFYLGSNAVPSDVIDRGIAFRYQSDSIAKLGFMGYHQETQEFLYIPDATEAPENNFTGANGTAHFGDVKVDSNLVVLSNGYLIFNGLGSQVGLRYNNSNLEVSNNTSALWNKLYTLSDLVAGNGLIKSGADNLTLDIQVDNSTLEINSDTLRVKDAGITNSQLGNSVITIDGQPLELGTSYSNLALSLSNASNYSAANLIGTITNSQLGNSVITISGVTYALGSDTANIILTTANAIVFRSEANTFIRSGTTSNIDISGTGNVNINANTEIVLSTLINSAVKVKGQPGSNQFAIVQSTNGNVYLNIGQTTGDNGYGIRSNTAGGLEFKNSSGNWTGFGTGSGGGGTPGGANTQIQFNDSSTFGGSANFTFNKATGNVSLTGNVNISALSLATHIQAANTFTISQYTSSLTNLSGTQTVALDFNQGSNFLITLSAGANITLSNPTNISRLGQQGTIIFKTPSSGTSHVLNWYRGSDSAWFFPDIISPPQISAGQNIYDVFSFMVVDTTSTGKVLVTDATGFQQFV
jgi:hypothetical protein